jgi:hypothetical protein
MESIGEEKKWKLSWKGEIVENIDISKQIECLRKWGLA